MKYDVINRGGALFVDHMQYEKFAERRAAERLMEESGHKWVCPVPYLSVFIGYDGLYYLCCSDWKKEAPMASVFEASILAISEQKLHHVTSREPVCRSCNHDPLNAVTDKIRAVNAGDASQAELDEMVATFTRESEDCIRRCRLGHGDCSPSSSQSSRSQGQTPDSGHRHLRLCVAASPR